MFSNFSFRIQWIFQFLSCLIVLSLSASSVKNRPGVRTLFTTKGLNFLRKLAVPVIIKKLNNLEISPISGNVNLFVGNLNYKFQNIKLSEVNIPDSHISVLNETGLSVEGTQITVKLNELWNYEFTSWPFISDSGSCTVSAKNLALNVIIGVSKGAKDEPSVTAKDCKLNIGKLNIEFRGGASFLYNLFAVFIKDRLKDQMEEVICRTAIKAVNKEINATMKTIPDKVQVSNGLQSNYELVCTPHFLNNGLEFDFKSEFVNIKHPKKCPYTPHILPRIKNEHSKMMYLWFTAYSINTIFFSLNQSASKQVIFYNKDLPDNVAVKLNTKYFMFIVPPLYSEYPDKDMAIGFCSTSPSRITLNPGEGYISMFGKMTFYVLLDENKLVDCFTLHVVEKANIDRILIFQKDKYSYVGVKLSSRQTDITLLESHIGTFDLTLLQMTVDILSQFIVSRYISPKTEEGFRLPLPRNATLTNSDTKIGKNYILISTDIELREHA